MVQLIAKDIKSIRMNRCLISYNNRILGNTRRESVAAMRLRSDDTATGMIAWRQNFPKVLSHNIIRFAVVKEWAVGQASFRADHLDIFDFKPPGAYQTALAQKLWPASMSPASASKSRIPGSNLM
jgi:hypothetical protein